MEGGGFVKIMGVTCPECKGILGEIGDLVEYPTVTIQGKKVKHYRFQSGVYFFCPECGAALELKISGDSVIIGCHQPGMIVLQEKEDKPAQFNRGKDDACREFFDGPHSFG
jgi:hypothetical protein